MLAALAMPARSRWHSDSMTTVLNRTSARGPASSASYGQLDNQALTSHPHPLLHLLLKKRLASPTPPDSDH